MTAARPSLPDLARSVLSALGVPRSESALELPPARRICLLLIDGLGWELLRAHRVDAPFLASLLPAGRELSAGFPSTTGTSLGSLGTGRASGEHGMLGYQVAVPDRGRLLNCLRWDERVDPVGWQPGETVYERAAADGVAVSYVAAGAYDGGGLNRAVQRGARYVAADSLGQIVAQTARALEEGERSFVSAYHPDLDATGHRFGAGSAEWRYQLSFVDMLVQRIAEALPAGADLYVTADHGMVNPSVRIDVDAQPQLKAGVAQLGGEARARYVYAKPGAAADVRAIWSETLAGRADVATREQAVDAGWFGPVAEWLLPRIGDLVVVPHDDVAIVSTKAEPRESSLIGMHGALSEQEQLIPLLRYSA